MPENRSHSSENVMDKSDHAGPARWFWVSLIVVTTVAVLGGGYAYYRYETDRIRQQRYEEIAAIGRLKARQIQQWRQERINDLSSSSKSPLLVKAVREWLQNFDNNTLGEEIRDRLVIEQKAEGYSDVLLLDTEYRVLLSAESQPHPLTPSARQVISQALDNRTVMLSDLYRCPRGVVHLDAVAPVLDAGGRAIAVLVLRSNAESLLYPLIQSWPTPSRTAETLLVRRDGEEVLFLNDLRHRPDSALSLREPLTLHELPAVQAVLGKEGIFRGTDYRGVEVLADLRPIPNSPWFMVAKVDTSELLSEVHYRGAVIALFAALFVLLAAGATAYGYRYRQARLYRNLYRSERDQREAQEEFRTILYSIGDAVITTDTGGLVKQMNPVAETLTGWPEKEAVGRPLEQVFRIINAQTRRPCENPVRKVLQNGQVVGLANHTLLIGHDGAERMLADSGAPIRAENGEILGVVLVFRDVTERARAAEELRKREGMSRAILAASPVGIVFTQDRRIKWANDSWVRMFGFESERQYLDHPTSLMHPSQESYDNVRELLYDHVKLEQVSEADASLKRKDGTLFDGHIRINLVDPSDPSKGTISAISDISERKKAEEVLRDSQQRLNQIINFLPDATLAIDRDGRVIAWNRAIEEMTGVPAQEMIGKGDYEYALPFYGIRRPILIDLVLTPNEEIRHAYSFFKADKNVLTVEADKATPLGKRLTLWAKATPLYDLHGTIIGAIETIRDITESKLAEEERAKSAQLLRAVLDASPAGIALLRNRQLEWGNKTFEDLMGVSLEEIKGSDARRFYASDEEYRRVGETIYPTLAKGTVRETEVLLKRSDGSTFPALLRLTTVGKPPGDQATVALFMDITERRKAEKDLHESREMLQLVLDTIPVHVFWKDRDSVYLGANRAWLKIAGLNSSQEVIGKTDYDLPWATDQANSYREHDRRVMESGIPEYDVIESYTRADGIMGWAKTNKAPLRDLDGKVVGVLGTDEDITARKHAEQALRESEEKYRVLVENANQGVFVAQDGVIRFFNPRTAQIVGYGGEELVSKPFTEFIHPDDREMVLQSHFRRLRGEEFPGRYPFRILPKDGNSKWAEIDVALIQWEGRPATLVLMSDVTERKQAEEALRESEEWYRSIVEESFDGIFVQKGPKIVYANSVLYEMLGYSAGELESMDHWLIYHTDYQEAVRKRARARMRGEMVSHQYEVKLQRKDGSHFDGEINARAVTVEGEPGVRVWVRDVSKRKRLEKVQRRLATAIEQSADAVVITDARGNVQYVNPAYERITGYSREEVAGFKPVLFKEPGLEPALERKFADSMATGKAWSGRTVRRRKDGALYTTDVTISPVRDPKGKIVNFVGLERDVTEEVRLQQQLVQAQKMEAIGTLAGGIAHDFNNLLTVVQGFSELLLLAKTENDRDYADLRKIFHAAKNGADLVQRLLMFSRKSEPKPVPMNLNRQIVQVEKLLRRTIPKMVDIHLDLSPDLPEINADSSQIEQVLMNLAVNARDAMPDGGKLTVRSSMATLDEEYCSLHVEANPGEYVSLEVADTGHGMDKETAEHIFEPFFTTKEMGRGTGLGLAMVYGIVKQHNGHITVYSEVDRGTTFRVYLPAVPAEEEPEVAENGFMPAFGTETVLLVDDEEFVRELGARILTKHGYTVLQVKNGREALDLFKQENSRISLVILDLIMPEMGGTECLKELLKIDPQVNVLVASGFSADASVKETIQMGAKGFVNKPFRMKDLLREVRRVLDEG